MAKIAAKPKLAEAKAEASTFITSSYEENLDRMIIAIHGQVGSGKTTLAGTASKHFPSEIPTTRHKGKPKWSLDDMLFIEIDREATVGFRERGINVNKFDINRFRSDPKMWKAWPHTKFINPPTILQAMEAALQVAQEFLYNGGEWIVIDTVSSFDRELCLYWLSDEHCPRNRSGVKDTRGGYGMIRNSHLRLHELCRSLPGSVIYCCHSKFADLDGMSPEEKKRALVLSVPGMPAVMPEVTGSGALAYKADASLELALIANPVVGSKGTLQRMAYTTVQESREAKNRFELSLQPKEEAHLGKILKKIRA